MPYPVGDDTIRTGCSTIWPYRGLLNPFNRSIYLSSTLVLTNTLTDRVHDGNLAITNYQRQYSLWETKDTVIMGRLGIVILNQGSTAVQHITQSPNAVQDDVIDAQLCVDCFDGLLPAAYFYAV